MSKNYSLAIIAIAALMPALPALAQTGVGSGRGPRVRPPFTAEFKVTRVRTLANGTTITTETTEKMARDQDQRRMTSTTTGPVGDRPAVTNVHVSDPTTGDEFNWNSQTKVARDVRRPVGADRHGCWATPDGRNRMSYGGGPAAASLLQTPTPPAGANTPVTSPLAESESAAPVLNSRGDEPGTPAALASKVPPGSIANWKQEPGSNNMVSDNLGTDTIMGVQVFGSRTTVTTPAGAEGNSQPLVHTEETWMAPSLGMALRSISDDPRMGKSDREVVKLDLNNPDASLFQPPADYKVDTEVMQPVACTQ